MSLVYLYSYICILFFVGLWPFNFWQVNQAVMSKTAGVRFEPPATAYTKIPPQKLSHLKEFTVFLDVNPDWEEKSGYGRIFGYSLGAEDLNFMAAQRKDALVFRVNADHQSRPVHLEREGVFKDGQRTWFAVVYNGKALALYQEGALLKALAADRLTFSIWRDTYPIVMGSEANGGHCWRGNIHSAAIFARAIPPEEIRGLPERIGQGLPLLWYRFGETNGRTVFDHGSGVPADLAVPRHFVPFKRTVLQLPTMDLALYQYQFMDILVNIVGFLPFGFLLAAYLDRRRASLKRILLTSTVFGMGTSMIIELLQVFLPTRNSSLTDVIVNTMGAFFGALILTSLCSKGDTESKPLLGVGGEMTDLAGRQRQDLTKGRIPIRTVMEVLNRHVLFLFFTLVSVAMFYDPLRTLLRSYTEADSYLHIILIPLVSGYFIYEKRDTLFSNLTFSWKAGIPLLLIGLSIFFYAKTHEPDFVSRDYASAVTFAAVIFWTGSFLLVYGVGTFRAMLFPFVFLLFMIPLPSALMDGLVAVLRDGSTELSNVLFRLTGIPFVREGHIFHLPGVSVEVADQCSGVHSSFALLIVGILAAHLFIKTKWKKAVLIVVIIPIVMIKNAVRIVTLSLLGAYVDQQILTRSFLHQSGGFLFYLPALFLVIAAIWLLAKTERRG
jgi:exosortase